MRHNLIIRGCVILALLPTAPAFAQDFNGPHAGVQGGWAQTDVRNPETDLGTFAIDDDRQSFTGGLFVGYDQQVAPRIVLGVEGGLDFSSDDSVESTSGAGLVSVDPEWSIDFTSRAGYLVDPSTLAYVRGGYTNASVETSVTNGTRTDRKREPERLAVGAGSSGSSANVSGRLEYRYPI